MSKSPSLLSAPRVFHVLVLHYIFGAILLLSLIMKLCFLTPSGLSQSFKILGFKSCRFLRTQEIQPFSFPRQIFHPPCSWTSQCESIFYPSPCHELPLHCVRQPCVFTLPVFFNVPSLILVVEFVLPVFGFLGNIWLWVFSSCISGRK